ncbi:MAG: histidine--tRNA ligase [Microbacteriaceae bacterium]
MATPVNPPRGMRDFLPAEKARRERVLAVIRDSYRAHGFDEIETPVVEDSARLHAGLGGDNEKLAFGILKRGLSAEAIHEAREPLDLVDLGLRFDLTVPLARFYASHRAELPGVFRAVQIAPVWRAERPQKGRYRQFVQCDIDIIGEPGPLAEVELIQATLAALDALGIEGTSVRVNDRRILSALLGVLGFPHGSHAAVLVTVDKLDKIGPAGVVQELRDRFLPDDPVDALEAFLHRPVTLEHHVFGRLAIRKLLPPEVPDDAIADLVAIGAGLDEPSRRRLRFDPFLVRGMGYYTGAIFEIAHPDLGHSLGGGGRYDGMIGRFLGQSVPATGFSLGFERLVDLVELPPAGAGDAVALLHEGADVATLAALKAGLVARGARVRLERRPKRIAALLDELGAAGYGRWAAVTPETTSVDELELKPIG